MKLSYTSSYEQSVEIKHALAKHKFKVSAFCRKHKIQYSTISGWMNLREKAIGKDGKQLSAYSQIEKFISAFETLTAE